MSTVDRILWLAIGSTIASVAFIVSDVIDKRSLPPTRFIAAQCYTYDSEHQVWNRLTNDRP